MAKAAANIPAPALGPQTSHSDYISRPNTSHSPGPHFAVKLTQRVGSDSDPRRGRQLDTSTYEFADLFSLT